MNRQIEAKPTINVTPLIDVLLVLLIIFMVVSPMKPSTFKTKVPQEPDNSKPVLNPYSIVITINPDLTVKINGETGYGTIHETEKLIERLKIVFAKRLENRLYADGMETRSDLPDWERIEKTVFIKSNKDSRYGEVTKIVDAAKEAGAQPIGLQIDNLE